MKFDLHCHSTASDGKLSPQDVLAEAKKSGVSLFALTDHDTVDGYLSVRDQAEGIQLVSGIELSSLWSGMSIHIVGLDFDAEHPAIQQAIGDLRKAREERAYKLDKKLEKLGMPNTLQGALRFCPDIGQIGRPHFAEYMVKQGYVESINKAFDQWLGAGKIGDIKTGFPSMENCVEAINKAGGVAVIAHPLRYKMTMTKLRALISCFKQAGGQAVEVSNTQMHPDKRIQLCRYIEQQGLAGSGGADFHSPEWQWTQIGNIPSIPQTIQPVWELFKQTKVIAS